MDGEIARWLGDDLWIKTGGPMGSERQLKSGKLVWLGTDGSACLGNTYIETLPIETRVKLTRGCQQVEAIASRERYKELYRDELMRANPDAPVIEVNDGTGRFAHLSRLSQLGVSFK